MAKKLKYGSIKAYPIFRVGTWNNRTFTREELVDIVAAFHELKKVHQVPVKLGHNDEQPLTDGQPALGWIADVRMVGDAIVADFTDVPAILIDLMKKKRYRAVSVELLLGAKLGDKTFKYILDAVAILGADQPAVRALPDLSLYLAKRFSGDGDGRRVQFEEQADKKVFQSRSTAGGSSMDEEDIKKLVATSVAAAVGPLQDANDELRKENADWKKKFQDEEDKRIAAESTAKEVAARDKERAEEAKKAAVKLARDKCNEVLELAVKAKVITPAQRESSAVMFGINDDERVVKLKVDDLRAHFQLDDEEVKKRLETKDTTNSRGDDENGRVHKDVFAEVDRRTRVAMGQNAKLSYKEASHQVFIADPTLHREYLDTPPPMLRVAGGAK